VLPPSNQPPWGRLLFGNDAGEVLDGAPPALGDSFFEWVFINNAPGAPLSDLIAQFVFGPTIETIMLSFEASADGVLREAFGVPDGTPGNMQVTQTAPFRHWGVGFATAAWPAEHINLRVVGR
jgi:hypothetical protein